MSNPKTLMILIALGALVSIGCGPAATPGEGPETKNNGMSGVLPPSPKGYVSDGIQKASVQSTLLMSAESYAGRLSAVEIVVFNDTNANAFIGRIRNETGAPLCDVRVSILLDGARQVDVTPVPGMQVKDGVEFRVPSDGMAYTEWRVKLDASGCSSVGAALGYAGNPAGMEGGSGGEGGNEGGGEGHGSEGGGSEGGEGGSEGGEGGSEGGGEGGGEGGEGGTVLFPVADTFSGVVDSINFTNFAWDGANKVFRGTFVNSSGAKLCAHRLEVHTTLPNGSTLELGPSMITDLLPDEAHKVVFEPGETVTEYQLHPESFFCSMP